MKCTVLIPSYNRVAALLELLDAVCRQRYPDFEVMVIEQSTQVDPEHARRLDEIVARDPRVRLEKHPPLGVGGARNAGVRSARGEVVLIIDDDDLPASDDWIAHHMKNYADPNCIAVHGREDRIDGTGSLIERRFPRLAYHLAMSYAPFGTPLTMPGLTVRKQGTKYLRGGNSSIRRQWAIDAGGWIDECGNGQEEHDFSFRLRSIMKEGMYIAFDPTACMIRRMNIPGGADRRTATLAREIEGNVRFYFHVLRRHQPWRVAAFLPFYPAVIFAQGLSWYIDDRAHERWPARALGIGKLCVSYPYLFVRACVRGRKPRLQHPYTPIRPGLERPTPVARS